MSRRTEQVLVFIGAFIFFLATLAANFSGPHDSIGYLNGIVSGEHLFHPHHLVYHFVTHYWFVFIKTLLPHVKYYYLVELFTVIWGSSIMLVVYNFFRHRFLLPFFTAVTGTMVVAFTYGPWFYSVNIEVYAPPMFFLLLALYILTKNDFQKQDVWKVTTLHILAVLFHQVHVLFAVVILYKLWQERKRINLISSTAKYALTSIVVVGAAYFMVGWVIEGNSSIAKWKDWFEGYAQEGAYWKPLDSRLPQLIVTGYAHAFIGGHFVFRLPAVEHYLNHSLADHSLSDEIYLARHISHSLAIFLSVLSILLGVVMLWLVIRFVRYYRTITRTAGKVVTPLMIAGIVYSVFFCFWMPEILEFWIFQTILVWLLLIGSFQYGGQGLPVFKGWGPVKPFVVIAFISAMLFIINFFGSMRWIRDIENDLYYIKIKKVKQVLTKNDVVLLQDAWQLKDFLTYFSSAKAIEVPKANSLRPAVDKAVNDCLNKGGRLYIYTEATHYQPQGTVYIDSLLKVYDTRKKPFPDSTAVIWVVQ